LIMAALSEADALLSCGLKILLNCAIF